MLGRAEKGLAQLKNAWYGRKTLGIAEKCLEKPKNAQKRRNAARQSRNVHISEVLSLWGTVHVYFGITYRDTHLATASQANRAFQSETGTYMYVGLAATDDILTL